MNLYRTIVRDMKQRYQLRVRRWRTAMTGAAWQVHYHDGRTIRWIEAPYPKSPISLAVFLHEAAHHAIGFDRYPLSSEEEYHAWLWALRQMSHYGIEPDDRVRRRAERSVQYAVQKDFRRGIRHFPITLKRFLPDAA